MEFFKFKNILVNKLITFYFDYHQHTSLHTYNAMYNYFNLHNNKYIKYHSVVVIKIKNLNLCLFSLQRDKIKNNLKFGSSCFWGWLIVKQMHLFITKPSGKGLKLHKNLKEDISLSFHSN